jgi:membrane-associated phospholipid phosphatase
VRWAAYAGYLAVLIALVAVYGVHTGWGTLAIIFAIGLLLTTIGRSWRSSAQVLIDWLPFIAVLVLYDRTRGLANDLGIPLHEADIVRAEKWCFGGVEPTIWLQQHLYHPDRVYWYDAAVTLVYTTHFVATPILAMVLWLRDRALWLRYIVRITVLALAGLLTYCLFPEAPPWMAARDGLTGPVARLSARGWTWLHLSSVTHALSSAQDGGSNPVAAMPSLHIAFAVLVALMIGIRLRSRWRYLLALYPLAMGFALVYTGEHYVLDLVFGVLYALAAHLGVSRWEVWRARRSTTTLAEATALDPPAQEALEAR